MPAAPIPPPFERMERRKFSFHPPILQVSSNEWTYRQATWSEILVRNSVTGGDLWIPRRFFGSASEADGSVVISLRDQLEYRDGSVRPHRSRVLEMPRPATVDSPSTSPQPRQPAPVIGIRLEPATESRASRIAGGAVALGVLGCLAVVGYSLQDSYAHRRALVTSLEKTYLALDASENYAAVVHTLGAPDSDRWILTPQGQRLHLLDYPERGFRSVLLADGDRERYIGSVDLSGRVLQSVLVDNGVTSAFLLRALENK